VSEGPSLNGDNGDGRDSAGRFASGNAFGQGRRRGAAIARYRRAIDERIDPEQVVKVLEKLAELAVAGDVKAAELFLNRVLGRPAEEPVETADGLRDPREYAAAWVHAVRTMPGRLVAAPFLRPGGEP